MTKFKKVYVEITNACNLSCSFCSKTNRSIQFLSTDEFSHILKQIKPYTKTLYLHVKGEPLLHPKLSHFLDLIEQEGLRVNLTTNGVLLPQMVEVLSSKKALCKINISLHCEQTNPVYFEEVFQAVSKLPQTITVIYRIWTLKEGILDKKSTEIVEKLVSFYHLSSHAVDSIFCQNQIQIKKNIYLDKANLFEWPSEASSDTEVGYCYALKTQIAVLSDGTVVPCCLDAEGEIPLGNLFQEELSQIISSERYQKLQKSFQNRKPCELLCKKCSFKERFTKS